MKKYKQPIAWIILAIGLVVFFMGCFVPVMKTLSPFSLLEFYIVKTALIVSGLAIGVCAFLYLRGYFTRRLEELFVNVLVLCVVSVFTFIVVEVALHLVQPAKMPSYKQNDQLLHHSLVPNASTRFIAREWDVAVTVNADGLRDDPVVATGDTRILMLGDSFTWGWGVEQHETASSIVERELRAQGTPVDVLNAGVGSYSPILEYLYLKNKGLALAPDVVVLNFDMSDVYNDREYEKLAVFENNELVAVRYEEAERHPFIILYQSILSITRIQNLLDQVYGRYADKVEMDTPWARDLSYNVYATLRTDVEQEQFTQDWERSFTYIRAIAQLCEQNNITFVLSTYPYGVQVSTDEWAYGRHRFGFGDDSIYSREPMRVLADFAQEENMLFFDATPAFLNATGPLYFPYDGHFNAAGQAVYGTALAAYLAAHTE